MMRSVRRKVAENMFRVTITTLTDIEQMFAAMPQQLSGGELPEELIAVLQAQMQKKAMEQGAITVNGNMAGGDQSFSVSGSQPQAQGPRIVLQPAVRLTPKVGANEPCPCGSGKKYKKCCGK